MSRSTKTRLTTAWIPIKDLPIIVDLCESFNQGRIYEIFGEYCNLPSNILNEKGAHCWLYYENNRLCGFALGRLKQKDATHMSGAFVFEEVWGSCDGLSNELSTPSKRDISRVFQFRQLIDSVNCESSIILRAATDNQFAHMIARGLKARWVNGLVIAEKTLDKKVNFLNPAGYSFRLFEDGDQFYMSKIHETAFQEKFKQEIYKAWATATNCQTIIATYHNTPIGFIIAEKRRCGSLGDFIIAVKPAHQGKGVGSLLLNAAFNVFIDMGVKRIIADYLMLNTSAHRLYQKHKFEPKRIYNYFLYKQGT
jgi:GNAT superfamily N-acetyltransferase